MVRVMVETIVIVKARTEAAVGNRRRRHSPRPMGTFTCRACSRQVSFHATVSLLLVSCSGGELRRNVLTNAKTGARVHDCAVVRDWWCYACDEFREVHSRQGVVRKPECPTCNGPLKMVEVHYQLPPEPLKPIDLF